MCFMNEMENADLRQQLQEHVENKGIIDLYFEAWLHEVTVRLGKSH